MTSTQTALDKLLTEPTISAPEYAALVGVSRHTAYRLIRSGKLPAVHIGTRVRIPSAVVRKQLGIDD